MRLRDRIKQANTECNALGFSDRESRIVESILKNST